MKRPGKGYTTGVGTRNAPNGGVQNPVPTSSIASVQRLHHQPRKRPLPVRADTGAARQIGSGGGRRPAQWRSHGIFPERLLHLLIILFLLVVLLPPPLPLPEDGEEGPEVKVRPEHVEEGDVGVLVALPEHEVAEAVHAGCADEEVEGRVVGGEHVRGQG
jgi:hypothetical protein